MPLFSIKKRLKRFTNFVTNKKSSSSSASASKTINDDTTTNSDCAAGNENVTTKTICCSNNIKNNLTYPDRDEKNSYRDYSKNRELHGVCSKKKIDGKHSINEDKLCNVSVSKNVRSKENVSVSIAEAERSEFFVFFFYVEKN